MTAAHPAPVFRGLFVTLWLTTLTSSLSFHLLTAGLPLYAARLGADDAEVGMLTGLIASAALLFRPLSGWWIEVAGSAVPSLVAGTMLYPLSTLGYWASGSVAMLLAFRVVQGVGIALTGTANQTLAADFSPVERRGEALSLFAIAPTFAMGLGPPIGVALAHAVGYHGLFLVAIGVGTFSLMLAWPMRRVRPRSTVPRQRRLFNRTAILPGLLLLTLMVTFGTTFALLPIHASRRGLPNPGMVFLAFAAGLLLAQSVVGRFSDRFGRRAVILPGLLLAAAGVWATAVLSGWALFPAGALLGIGIGAGQPALYALAADLSPPDRRGSAMGTMGVFHEIGIGSGAIGGGIVGRALGLDAMFALAGLAPLVGALLLLRGRRHV